jgi:hypothetical protein
MAEPTRRRPGLASPDAAQRNLIAGLKDSNKTDDEIVDAVHARWPDIPVEKLAAPTLGAWRRANGVEGWCDEARVLLAVELVHEAQRRILLERLDSIMEFVAVGATPDQAMNRIRRLVADYDNRPMEKAA